MEVETFRNDLLPAIRRWQAAGEEIAVATVVRVNGTAPRREGSKLVVSAGGELAGSVSGGCVEGAVLEEALRVLRARRPVLLQYGITADMLTDVGLSCGGQIDVFVEPLNAVPGVYDRLAEELAANRPAALATAITGDLAGARLLLPGTGAPQGSIHPALDARIAAEARELLAAGQNGSHFYDLDGTPVEVFIETFPRAQRLIIVGAVHVAIPLHRLAKTLGYHVTVVDARGMLATPERFPQADAILTDWPDEALAKLAPDSATSIVVLTHDPKFDQPALLTALQTPARYIGAIGSRTTNEQRRADLREQGVEDEDLARIFAPIGLDLGAESPAEIALAIMAEIVATRRHRHGGHLRTSGLPVPAT